MPTIICRMRGWRRTGQRSWRTRQLTRWSLRALARRIGQMSPSSPSRNRPARFPRSGCTRRYGARQQSPDWRDKLEALLAQFPQAGVGEIGLNRRIENADVDWQQRFFTEQLALATQLNRAASVHSPARLGLDGRDPAHHPTARAWLPPALVWRPRRDGAQLCQARGLFLRVP